MKVETIETLAMAGNRATGAGASMGLYGWLASSEFVGLAGVAIALLGMLVNMYYRRKADMRAHHEYLLRTELMRKNWPDTRPAPLQGEDD